MCDWILQLTVDKLAIGSAIGALVSLFAERWPWFQNLSSEYKKAVIFALSILLPITAMFAAVYLSCDFALTVEALAVGIAAGIASFLASQANHNYINK